MALLKSFLITLICSAFILGALAVKEYDDNFNGEKTKFAVEDVNVQSSPAWSLFPSSLDYLKKSPFSNFNINILDFGLDPIGLILIICAFSVNRAIGSLVYGWAEYLPTFSSHTVVTNEITQPLPGYTLYNITDKMQALDVAGWFSKFLICHNLGYISTTITLKRYESDKRTLKSKNYQKLQTAVLTVLPIISVSSVVMVFANVYNKINLLCILGLVTCRYIAIGELRLGCDRMVRNALSKDEKVGSSSYSMYDVCKIWLTMPDGNAVQIRGPRGLIRCLLTTPQPAWPMYYNTVRHISSVLLGVQALTLGMTSTTYQIISLSILALSTVLLTSKTTLDPGTKIATTIGNELELTVEDTKVIGSHMSVFAKMGLDEDEAESMRLWGLVPHASNKGLWMAYESLKGEMDGDRITTMD